jgi:hypothetical protein
MAVTSRSGWNLSPAAPWPECQMYSAVDMSPFVLMLYVHRRLL